MVDLGNSIVSCDNVMKHGSFFIGVKKLELFFKKLKFRVEAMN